MVESFKLIETFVLRYCVNSTKQCNGYYLTFQQNL